MSFGRGAAGVARRGLVAWMALSVPAVGAAQPASGAADVSLGTYLEAFSERRLIAAETGSVEDLRALARRGEELYFGGRFDEAAVVLYEAVESPRFADFVDLEEYLGARFMLAGALIELGALSTAARYLEAAVARGPEDGLFAPAFRRYVDVALSGGRLPPAIEALSRAVPEESLPEDAANELRYLRGREAYDRGDVAAAEGFFAAITRRSRFFTNAHYFLGVIEVRRNDLVRAEEHFCSIATMNDTEQFSFYIDDRYFQVKDLAWVALGRVAHEAGRADDAFYYYFQVPSDSERVAEALFEGAYAMYEGNDFDTAVDLLDQLEARFPASEFVHEGMLLRGYVHLGRCEFAEAEILFRRYLERFGPVVEEIDGILASPSQRARLYDALLLAESRALRDVGETVTDAEARERAEESLESATGVLLAMLQVDPEFFALHAQVAALDAEAARAGRVPQDLLALAARVSGEEAPQAAVELERQATEAADLRRDLRLARELVAGLEDQLGALRRAGAPARELAPLRRDVQALDRRIGELGRRLRRAEAGTVAESEPTAPEGEGVEALLHRDARFARRLPARVARVRGGLVDAASARAVASLSVLRERLAAGMRRARIGQIDAVMGSKRRIELQIESLAAGRFPPELQDALRMQGMLREDEEYWPYEGEYWADEFEESTYEAPEEGEAAEGEESAEPSEGGAEGAE